MGNIYAYYLLMYAPVCLRIPKIYVLFVFSTTIKYFTFAYTFVRVSEWVSNWVSAWIGGGKEKLWDAFHITGRRNSHPLGMSLRQNSKSCTPHIKLLNFTPSRVSYHQIKGHRLIFYFHFALRFICFIWFRSLSNGDGNSIKSTYEFSVVLGTIHQL